MKIVKEFPPNIQLIKEAFPHLEKHKPIFAYGDTIYNPFSIDVGYDLEVHEEVHSKQQGDDPEGWWMKYCSDIPFRVNQEIEAYSHQFYLAKKNGVKGELLDWVKEKCAEGLSSTLYQSSLTYGEAESKIRNFVKNLEKQRSLV